MAKNSRVQKKVVAKHRARKGRVRPLDVARADNHAARHAAKKVKRAAHEALMAQQAEEKEAREAEAPGRNLIVGRTFGGEVPGPRSEAEEKADREQEEETQRALRDAECIVDVTELFFPERFTDPGCLPVGD